MLGQALTEDYENQLVNMPHDAPWHEKFFVKYRRIVGMVIPALVFHQLWWAYFIKFNTWYLFEEHYVISIMMIFGSMIAGTLFYKLIRSVILLTRLPDILLYSASVI